MSEFLKWALLRHIVGEFEKECSKYNKNRDSQRQHNPHFGLNNSLDNFCGKFSCAM